MVGFYALALVVAAALLYLPYAEWRYVDRLDLRLLFFSGAGVIAILAAITPRVDRFEAPGPLLTAQEHPGLFRLIEETAHATAQSAPTQVYLIPDLNAWVAQRGGVMGIGGARMMGVGLPLLQVLTVAEFRAVLAHEFGHFHGGDTALGPWIYNTRSAIGRTLQNLTGQHGLIGKPFEWYGAFFLRITHGVSRDQEYAADALAARVAGGEALVSGLKAIHASAAAFPPYWANEVVPALETGIRPPILAGFRSFLSSPDVAPGIAAHLEKELLSGVSDPLDTHPALKDRIEAIRLATASSAAPASPVAVPAVSLFPNPDQLEEALVDSLLPPARRATLTAAAWTEVGARVWLPRWKELVSNNRARLCGLQAAELFTLAVTPTSLPVRLELASDPAVASRRHVEESCLLIGAVVAVALHQLGFGFTARPGERIVFTRDGLSLQPFELIEQLHAGVLSADWWTAFCRDSGLDRADLASLAA